MTIGFMCERVPFVRRLAIASPATSRDGDLYHSHPHLQRTESHKRSFFNSSLQTAQDRIHIALLLDTSVSSSDGKRYIWPGEVDSGLLSAEFAACQASRRALHRVGLLEQGSGGSYGVS